MFLVTIGRKIETKLCDVILDFLHGATQAHCVPSPIVFLDEVNLDSSNFLFCREIELIISMKI